MFLVRAGGGGTFTDFLFTYAPVSPPLPPIPLLMRKGEEREFDFREVQSLSYCFIFEAKKDFFL
jgi:hypothetical protein